MRAKLIAVTVIACGLAVMGSGISVAQTTAPGTLKFAPPKCGASLSDWLPKSGPVTYSNKDVSLTFASAVAPKGSGTVKFDKSPSDSAKKFFSGNMSYKFENSAFSWKAAGAGGKGKEAKLLDPKCEGGANATAVTSAMLDVDFVKKGTRVQRAK